MKIDAILTRRLGGDDLVLYDYEDFSNLFLGLSSMPIKELSVQKVGFIQVPNWQDYQRRGGLLFADQFRLRIVDNAEPHMFNPLLCEPDRPVAWLHALIFGAHRLKSKTVWRVKATLQIWGILPWDGRMQ